MKLLISLTVVAFSGLFLAVPGFTAEMRDGLWELTTTMEMSGMKMPPQKMTHCYTKEDVKDQKKMVNNNKDCKVTDLTSSGNKVKWKMKCTGANAGTFTGETIFNGDNYNSAMKMQSEGMVMDMQVAGKRIGACK